MQQGGHGASGGPRSGHPSPPEAESTEGNLVTITGSLPGVCPGHPEDIPGSRRSLSDSPSWLPETDVKCLTAEQGSFLPSFRKSMLPASTGHDSHGTCPSGGQPPESRSPSVRAAHPGLRTAAPSLSAACLSGPRPSGVPDPGGHWHTPGTLVRIRGET